MCPGARSLPALGREERQLRLALAAQQREVDLDEADPARLRKRVRLRLALLGREDAAAALFRRIEPDALEIAAELLDSVDRDGPLDFDRHPAALGVAAHQVDGAEVGRPLAAVEPQAGLERFR